ncbi:MAG: DinB family protein [Gemmatimonadales bacterium]|nr:DinB family protein [Gemmatimonadales bacterium]
MESWAADLEAHRDAVRQVGEAARAVPPDRWAVPPAEGKWSAGEVTMHLTLTYEHLAGEQEGVRVIPVKVPRLKAWALRRFALPRLLAGRPIPPGVRSPREVRPAGDIRPAPEAIEALFQVAGRWEDAMVRNLPNQAARSVHPFFGALPLPTMLRFVTIHTNHHCRQIRLAAEGRTLHGD